MKLATRSMSGLASGVTSLSCGQYHCCAVVGSNVKCWGRNAQYQLGDGTTTDHKMILTDGTTRCWGYNGDAGLSGDYTTYSTPFDTTKLSGVQDIAVGEFWGCAILTGGKGYCWGEVPPYSGTPTKPAAFGGIVSGATNVSSGNSNTCFVIAGGLRCFGQNVEGELGDGTTTTRDLLVSPKW